QPNLRGANLPNTMSKKKQRGRCAICVHSYCLKRHDCPGRGKRDLCACGHPPLTRATRI
ncbi:hypothetical protein R3P38DRAFT_2374573, partial [Favolaschia claudopus]